MSSEPEEDLYWDSCPTGLISQTAERQLESPIEQEKRQRRTFLWSLVSLVLLLVLIGYSLYEAKPAAPLQDAALDCQSVKGNLAAFCNNQIQDDKLEREISKHLIDCKGCHREYRKICNCEKQCPHRMRQARPKPWMAQSYK